MAAVPDGILLEWEGVLFIVDFLGEIKVSKWGMNEEKGLVMQIYE